MFRTVMGCALLLTAMSANSAVLTGSINDWAESSEQTFGDGGINDFTITWSTASTSGGNGWFYGSDYDASYPDFYIYTGGVDVATVHDASIFAYQSNPGTFNDGDTIFLRGATGYYGALDVLEVYPNPSGPEFPYTYLNGDWSFQDDGSSSFSEVVPIPAAAWLFGSALLGLGVIKRKTA